MDLDAKKRDLLEIESSLIRLDEIISRQLKIIAQLENDGQVKPAKLARSLLRQYEFSFDNLCTRRDWLRQILDQNYKGGSPSPPPVKFYSAQASLRTLHNMKSLTGLVMVIVHWNFEQ